MIVLFMIVSFITGCVDRMCQSFLSECFLYVASVFFLFFFFNHSFWRCRYGFLTFSCLWEIRVFSQTISGTVSWLLGLDRIFK